MKLVYLFLSIFTNSQDCINEYYDFINTNWTASQQDFKKLQKFDFISELNPNYVTSNNGHIILGMFVAHGRKSFRGEKIGHGSAFSTTKLFKYGRVTANLKAGSTSPGVVSMFKFETRNSEVISISVTGKNPTSVHTNFQTSRRQLFGNSEEADLNVDLTEDWHDYTIDWGPSKLQFFVDEKLIRSIYKESNEALYPITPSHVKFELFDAGGMNEKYANWAGFPTNFGDDIKYEMDIDSLEIECYNEDNERNKDNEDGSDYDNK
jgi:beta-glucanase (GH16 family)